MGAIAFKGGRGAGSFDGVGDQSEAGNGLVGECAAKGGRDQGRGAAGHRDRGVLNAGR